MVFMARMMSVLALGMMTVAVPKLAELQKEGESGYAKINQYTRYLTVVLAALQELPHKIADPMLRKIMEQANTQLAPNGA